jgi:hypothetical protein
MMGKVHDDLPPAILEGNGAISSAFPPRKSWFMRNSTTGNKGRKVVSEVSRLNFIFEAVNRVHGISRVGSRFSQSIFNGRIQKRL